MTDDGPPTSALSLPFPPIVRSSATLMITTAVAAIANATRPLRRDEDIRTPVLFDYTVTSKRAPEEPKGRAPSPEEAEESEPERRRAPGHPYAGVGPRTTPSSRSSPIVTVWPV